VCCENCENTWEADVVQTPVIIAKPDPGQGEVEVGMFQVEYFTPCTYVSYLPFDNALNETAT